MKKKKIYFLTVLATILFACSSVEKARPKQETETQGCHLSPDDEELVKPAARDKTPKERTMSPIVEFGIVFVNFLDRLQL